MIFQWHPMLRRWLLVFLFLCPWILVAQQTWIQRVEYLGSDIYRNHDTITGLCDLKIGIDGSAFALVYYDQDSQEKLVKYSDTNHVMQWRNIVGYHSGMSGLFTNHLFPTRDSGCITAKNNWQYTFFPMYRGGVIKYSKAGVIEWSIDFGTNNTSFTYELIVKDVVQNTFGNYFVLAGDGNTDSLFEISNNGYLMYQSGGIHGDQMFPVSNGELLIHTVHDTLVRTDSSSTIIWSIPCDGILAATDSFAITFYQNDIRKIDCVSGQVIWSQSFPFGLSSATITPDGGFIGSGGIIHSNQAPYYNSSLLVPGSLCRVDASGNLVWSKQFQFPHYGLTCVARSNSGAILTGGAFLFTDNYHAFYRRDYSAFICSLDSMGNGVLDSTSLTWPGDANYNQYASFTDDILYTGIALGYNGPARDTIDDNGNPWPYPGDRSEFATDWDRSFVSGANYKHADFNGDGQIDTNDIALYSQCWTYPLTIPNWRIGQHKNSSAFIPELKFSAANDSIAPGDTAVYYIILGSNTNSVDTIYGLAFSSNYNFQLSYVSPVLEFKNGQLGVQNTDLITSTSYFPPSSGSYLFSAMWCRTDRHDKYNILNDTLGILKIYIDPLLTTLSEFKLQIPELKALKFDQSEIQMNVVVDSVHIDIPGVGVHEYFSEIIQVYPNPANSKLYFKIVGFKGENINLEIFSDIGENIISKEISITESEEIQNIDVSDYSSGIYFLKVKNEDNISVQKFIIRK